MNVTRRSFVGAAVAAASLPQGDSKAVGRLESYPLSDRFDPWVEVDAKNLHFNGGQVGRLTKSRPIMAVVKNNAYGLGLVQTARLLEPLEAIAGFAVVKTDAAIALREAGPAIDGQDNKVAHFMPINEVPKLHVTRNCHGAALSTSDRMWQRDHDQKLFNTGVWPWAF